MLYAEHRFSHNKLCVWYFHLYDEMRALFVHVLKPKTKHLGDTLVGNTLFRFCYRRLYKKCDIQKTQYFSTPPRQNRTATIGRLKNGQRHNYFQQPYSSVAAITITRDMG